jgi:RND family efflux transporter MFP subunit
MNEAHSHPILRRLARNTFHLGLSLLILLAGIGLFLALKYSRSAPAQAEISEPRLSVEVKEVQPEEVQVTLTGTGEVRAVTAVPIAAEVSGRVTYIYPQLEAGVRVKAGDILFTMDPKDYERAEEQATHQVEQLEAALARLKEQYGYDSSRIETLKRSRDLAQAQFERLKKLLEQDEVGTQANVDAAEITYNQARDAFDQLQQAVSLYPLRIRETENALAAAKAQREVARHNRERTVVRAPFDGRVRTVNLEKDQVVRPGEPVLQFVDDSLLELPVPLDSVDVQQWLRFAEETAQDSPNISAWFPQPERVRCKILWTEAPSPDSFWEGTVDRIERFDPTSRMVRVVVQISAENLETQDKRLRLVEGMFCRVLIPGKTLSAVFRLPQRAVTFDGKVYIADGERLRVRDVSILRTEGEDVFIAAGLTPGDRVITTRLVNPLPNSLLSITNARL